jgi:transposase
MGVFARMMDGLASETKAPKTVMIDATYLKARCTASSLGLKKGGGGCLIDRTKDGMNTKSHAVADENCRPLSFFMSAGATSDYTGAAALLKSPPPAQWLLANRGYDAEWFRDGPQNKGIKPRIPGRNSRIKPVKYDRRVYKRCNRIEFLFGRLKYWRRVATRCDRCPKVSPSAIALAATVLFWL